MTDITWTTETRRLRDLVPWERNPRQINETEGKRLAESLETFAQVETIAIGPGNEVYNGHQRLNVWAERFGDIEVDVRVASRALTEKERQKLTVFLHWGTVGEWDRDMLANEFDAPDLLEWGFERWELGIVDDVDVDELWQGMPEFEQEDLGAFQTINVHFASEGDREAFAELVGQTLTEKTKSIWYPKAEIRTFMDKRYHEQS